MNRKISIVMSVYREPLDLLKITMDSLVNQTYKDYEIIIVLDDPENIILYNYLCEYAKNYSFIHLYKNEKNIGQTASLNRAINLAEGMYICRMDADDIAHEKRLEIQYKYIEEKGYDFIVSPVELIDQVGKDIGDTCYISKMTPKQYKSIMQYANLFVHSTFFFTKKFIDDIGGYDENYRLAQDYDLIIRALKITEIGITDECILKYRIWEENVSHVKEARQKYTMLLIQSREKEKSLDGFEKFSSIFKKYRKYGFSPYGLLIISSGMLFSKAFRIYMINMFIFKLKIWMHRRKKNL